MAGSSALADIPVFWFGVCMF